MSLKELNHTFLNDLYNKKFWEKLNIELFHCENNKQDLYIIVGNLTHQIQINFIQHLDNFYSYILNKDYTFYNSQICGLSLKYPKNRLYLRNVVNEFLFNNSLITQKNIENNFNLYLDNTTIIYKFPIDYNKIYNLNCKNIIYDNCDILKNIISKTSSKDIIIKEIKDFNSDLTFKDYIEPIENNIFKLYLHLYKNDIDKCKIQIDIDSNFYPMMPPKIKWISPIINKHDYASIINSKIFSTSWNPIINLKWLFTQLKKKIIDYEIKFNTILFSNSTSEFSLADNIIINFSKAIGRFVSSNTIEIDFNPIDKNNITTKTMHWNKGTGYGHNGLKNWNLESYLANQINIQNNIIKYIDQILSLKDISFEQKKYLCEQSFIELYGITLMDLEKNIKFYKKYYILLEFTYSNDFLFDKIKDWKNNIQNLIENITISQNETLGEIKDILQKINKKIIIKDDIIMEITDNNYETIMKPLQYTYYDVYKSKHTFKHHIGKPYNTKQMMRIAKEISSLQKSLPLNIDSSVWMRIDKNNMNTMQFLISGPKDTPYQDGLFLFDCHFNKSFPTGPPSVIIQTTGGGKFRFNPNLYANGKVCLSLLGTWEGIASEKWNEKTSTMLQVIVSIQSLIFIEEPYFNEPGYERDIGTKLGISKSTQYNQNIKVGTCLYAIKDIINNPPYGFEEIIIQHFINKKENIVNTLQNWKNNTTIVNHKSCINDTLEIIKKL